VLWLAVASFIFAAIGVKFLLGLAFVYALVPERTECVHCDGPTLPLRKATWLDTPLRFLGCGIRWCPACDASTLRRRAPDFNLPVSGRPES
jgi:hypothetical protein